jgi:serine/threonine-protein kinase
MTDLAPGSHVGRFRLERTLGKGAMGAVYLAVDPEIERSVAIKIIRMDAEADAEHRANVEVRFLKEAKIAGRLQHPNIVTIFDVGHDDDTVFIAMEYVEGKPLSRYLKPGIALTDEQRLLVLRQTADALAHAHERSVVHRDVKPANILIRSDGVAKVSDFGIGKLLGSSQLTQVGQLVGSPSYMSPEQIRGETLDGRSDLFSLGVVAYELFTGTRPFPGDTISSLMYQIVHKEPRDPLELRPELPPSAASLLKKALAKNRNERHADAKEFIRDLDRIGSESGSAGLPTAIVPFPAADLGSGDRLAASGGAMRRSGSATAPPATSAPTIVVEKRGGALLIGTAALVLAAAAFLYVVLQPLRSRNLPGESAVARTKAPVAATTPAAPPPTSVTISETAPSTIAAANSGSADSSSVGEPQPNPAPATPKPAKTALRPAKTAPEPNVQPEPKVAAPPADAGGPVDRVYRTGHGMKFQISPDQARLYVDGVYVGVADDWDDHGGGKVFPFNPGTHSVRATLPGYRDLRLQISVESGWRETESAGDEMVRLTREPYGKISKVSYATVSSIVFSPKVGAAAITVDGKPVGLATQFTPASPLKLTGPMVHDVVITREGQAGKTIRVLAASTAGKDNVEVKD